MEEVSEEFWSQVMVLGPSCERFDGWLSSDSENNLSPASQAKGTRLCVSMEGRGARVPLFTTLGCGDAAWGYSGRRATPDWGAQSRGGGQLEANVLHHDRSIVVRLSRVLLGAGGLDLTLAISLSLHITLNNHHPSEKGH